MDPKRTKDGIEDELDLLHDPEPERPDGTETEEGDVQPPGGGNFA